MSALVNRPESPPNRSPRPNGQHPVGLELDRVTDRRVAGDGDIGPRTAEAEAIELRAALERVLIVHVRGETVRQAPAQLELQRVVLAERAAVGDVGVVDVGVDDEEVRRVARGQCLIAARQVAVEIGRRGVRVRVRRRQAAGDRRVRPCRRGVGIGGGVASVGPAVEIRQVDGQRARAGAGAEVGERSGAAGGARRVVGREVGHRQVELVHESVGDEILSAVTRAGVAVGAPAVVVDRRPFVVAAVADVSDLDRGVSRHRSREANRPRPHPPDLDVRREGIDVVRAVDADGDRVGRIWIEGQGRESACLRE